MKKKPGCAVKKYYDLRANRYSFPMIPGVWNITAMIEFTELSQQELNTLSENDHCKYLEGYVGERTRQNINQADSLIKIRLVFLLRPTDDGVFWEIRVFIFIP